MKYLPAYRRFGTYLSYSSTMYISVIQVGEICFEASVYIDAHTKMSFCLPWLWYLPVIQQCTVRTLPVVK